MTLLASQRVYADYTWKRFWSYTHSLAIFGSALSKTLNSQMAADTLALEVAKRAGAPTILHSNRGSTYAAASTIALLLQ